MKKNTAFLLALLFYASILPWTANSAQQGRFSVLQVDNVLKGDGIPWVDVRAFMDGASGRNTLAAWEADQVNTDTTAAIQSAIDYAHLSKKTTVLLPPGTLRITKTIHLTYGDYAVMNLVGSGRSLYATPDRAGTTIIADFNEGPALSVQLGRFCSIKNMDIRGSSYRYALLNFYSNKWVTNTSTYSEISDPNSYVSNVSSNGKQRYTPYAAIVIDGYFGPAPTPPYPTVTYPAWTGRTDQYLAAGSGSSDTLIENVYIDGFWVGVAQTPSDNDGNGDFLTLKHVILTSCAYGVSIGQTQSRNVSMTDVSFSFLHTAVTNILNGKQKGSINGPMINCTGMAIYQLFDVDFSLSGPMAVINFYAEDIIRIGNTGPQNQTSVNSLDFIDCVFYGLGGVFGYYGIPAIEGNARVNFIGGTLFNWGGFSVLGVLEDTHSTKHIHIVNASFISYGASNVTGFTTPMKIAYGYTTGGFLVMSNERSLEGGATTGALFDGALTYPYPIRALYQSKFLQADGYRNQVHQFAEYARHGVYGEGGTEPIMFGGANQSYQYIDKGPQSASFDNSTRILTFLWPDSSMVWSNNHINVGDIVFDKDSSAIFVVDNTTYSAPNWTISSTMRTNYHTDNNGVTTVIRPIAATGYLRLVKTTDIVTYNVYRGDIAVDNNVIDNVTRSDGYGGQVPNDFAVGDKIWVSSADWDNYFSYGTYIDNVAASRITLNKNSPVTKQGVIIRLIK